MCHFQSGFFLVLGAKKPKEPVFRHPVYHGIREKWSPIKLILLDSLLQENMSSDDGIVYIPKYIMTIETYV